MSLKNLRFFDMYIVGIVSSKIKVHQIGSAWNLHSSASDGKFQLELITISYSLALVYIFDSFLADLGKN